MLYTVLICFIDVCCLFCGLFSGMDEEGNSLNLKMCIKRGGRDKLNPEAVKQIDSVRIYGNSVDVDGEELDMLPDESLLLPCNTLPLEKGRCFLCIPIRRILLMTGIRFYQKKIQVGKDTWRETLYRIKTFRDIPIHRRRR